MKRSGAAYTVVFIFGITFLMASLLSAAHTATLSRVERNQELRYQRAVLGAIGIQEELDSEISTRYAELDRIPVDAGVLYQARAGDSRVVAMPFSGPGVWGDITGVLALDPENDRLAGVVIIDHNETPGLGGRVTEPEFLAQFRGELVPPSGLALGRGGGDPDPDNGRIDAITGATGTSRAFHRIVNSVLVDLRSHATSLGLTRAQLAGRLR